MLDGGVRFQTHTLRPVPLDATPFSTLDSWPCQPSRYLPSFWAALALFGCILALLLTHMSTHWSVGFKAFMQVSACNSPRGHSIWVAFPDALPLSTALCSVALSSFTISSALFPSALFPLLSPLPSPLPSPPSSTLSSTLPSTLSFGLSVALPLLST